MPGAVGFFPRITNRLPAGGHAKLGLGAGSITYQAAGTLTPLTKEPPDLAARSTFTAETSNIKYQQVSALPQRKIIQNFRVAAPA